MLIEDDIKVTAEALKNFLLGKSTETRTILEVFQYHNKQIAALVGKEFAPFTLSRYKIAHEHTRSFIQWKYKVDDRRISDLNFEFISEFSFWIRSARGCNHDSAIRYMSKLKKIVLIYVNNKWLKKDPFQGFKLTKKKVLKIGCRGQSSNALQKKNLNWILLTTPVTSFFSAVIPALPT